MASRRQVVGRPVVAIVETAGADPRSVPAPPLVRLDTRSH